jgi:hypothetical protein
MLLVATVVEATIHTFLFIYLQYERSEESTSIDEETGVVTISTVGRCTTSEVSFWAFAGPLLGFHAILVLCTNILLYSVRDVADRYQERKYVAMASMLMLEILIVGIPVMIAVNDSPEATFILMTSIISLDAIGILCFIFMPKIMFQRKGLEEGVGFGESILRESHRRASVRELSRRSSSSFSQSEQFILEEEQSTTSQAEQRDSFTTKFSGEGKSSPFVVFSEGVSKNVVSESILEETSAELKLEEDASHSFATDQAPSQAEQTPAEARAKKRELESQLFSRSDSASNISESSRMNVPGIPSAAAAPTLMMSDDEKDVLGEQDRMMEASTKSMDEHERMMKATKEIMSEHRRLKERLLEAQMMQQAGQDEASPKESEEAKAVESAPAAPSDLTDYDQMKQQLPGSNAWSLGARENDFQVRKNDGVSKSSSAPSIPVKSEITAITEEEDWSASSSDGKQRREIV